MLIEILDQTTPGGRIAWQGTLPAVPREGESFELDGRAMVVHAVLWVLDTASGGYRVQIRVR